MVYSQEDQRKKLFKEITDRIPKKEESIPVRMGSYEYFRRYKANKEHPILVRRKDKNAKEEIFLDVNKLAKGSSFYQLSNWSISPLENQIAIAEDLRHTTI